MTETPIVADRPWFLYLLECTGDLLYAGISPDPQARFELHRQGKGARFTRANGVLRILAAKEYPSRAAASAAEYRLKQMRRPQKLAWAAQHPWNAAASLAE